MITQLVHLFLYLASRSQGSSSNSYQHFIAERETLGLKFSEDWGSKLLGNHVTFLRNGQHSRAQMSIGDPIRNLHYGDIHTTEAVRLDPNRFEMPRLSGVSASRLSKLTKGDLVFVDASEDLDGVGKSIEIEETGDLAVVAGQHTIAARFDRAVLSDGFKAYLQFIPEFKAHLRRLAAGTKVYATNRKHIASCEVKLPGTIEQAEIARALNEIDQVIELIEKRAAKVSAIKQAMMQALLTGRVRLPDRGAAAPQTKEAAHA